MKVVCKLSFKGCYSCYDDFASDYVLNQLKGEQVAVPDVFLCIVRSVGPGIYRVRQRDGRC